MTVDFMIKPGKSDRLITDKTLGEREKQLLPTGFVHMQNQPKASPLSFSLPLSTKRIDESKEKFPDLKVINTPQAALDKSSHSDYKPYSCSRQ